MADTATCAPRSALDLYAPDALSNPWPHYRALRDQGAAVWLERVGAFFIGRYEDVHRALNDWQTFSSARGIGLNPVINAAWSEALICTDPPLHAERRRLITQALGPAAIKPVAETIDRRAEQLADALIARGRFDGVADMACDLPIHVVMELIGWPLDVRPSLLAIAENAWNGAGPAGPLTTSGLETMAAMMDLIAEIYDNNRLVPGGYAEQLAQAARRGDIPREAAIGLLAGYVVAAFETTIAAMASGAWLFACNPAEWDKLCANPALAAQAANEIVRMETPLQKFARYVTADATMSDGTMIPADSWAIVSYGSANRDERQFADPDAFVIDRRERQNLGFGHGPHNCAGQGLARMELSAVFGALARRGCRFELDGEPERIVNNIAYGFARLPLRVVRG
ncbi:cytochrome P450 [Novosphingobium sp. FSY-8]|uniref:Cytochrome P450 n=1 Tax=Novosphingobium ovatum TaxID=1908523 RepID=A0ABW9XCB7_9SPHN|nr:cytochrome P450 [Novosphingobium ovatum]NBC36142.1 cytochrome P450 [Novosphingobium ovatum]